MKARIGIVKDLLVELTAEIRYIRKLSYKLHVTGIEDCAANSGITLNRGVFTVRMPTSVAIGYIL